MLQVQAAFLQHDQGALLLLLRQLTPGVCCSVDSCLVFLQSLSRSWVLPSNPLLMPNGQFLLLIQKELSNTVTFLITQSLLHWQPTMNNSTWCSPILSECCLPGIFIDSLVSLSNKHLYLYYSKLMYKLLKHIKMEKIVRIGVIGEEVNINTK